MLRLTNYNFTGVYKVLEQRLAAVEHLINGRMILVFRPLVVPKMFIKFRNIVLHISFVD